MAWVTFTASRAAPADLGYTAKELAAAFGVSPATIHKLRRDGVVSAVRLGGSIRFPRKAVTQLMNTRVARAT